MPLAIAITSDALGELAPARLFVAWPSEPESAEVASFVRAAKKVAGAETEVDTDSGKRRELSGSESSHEHS